MEPSEGFGKRVKKAWLEYQAAGGEPLEDYRLGELVSEFLGRAPYNRSTPTRWLQGSAPDLDTICAIACVLNVEPGRLAFGRWAVTSLAKIEMEALRATSTAPEEGQVGERGRATFPPRKRQRRSAGKPRDRKHRGAEEA